MSKNNNSTMQQNDQSARLPRKCFYRVRAHSNPLSDSHFPILISPADVDYLQYYPHFFPSERSDHDNGSTPTPKIRFADIGYGFGGLLVGLSPLFLDTLMIGMELRDKVTEYVKEWILALRATNPEIYTQLL
ncbi:putative tRNA (guanine-N(7)-)-methyltransferase [Cocos nucifera]|uniref:tRNA (guanine(46)-N(7))-methyltransferase n=1 Tax=Cocos nucifera TaxID=13894 RepID=A0A8K0IX29_COCNU|nr:putative tRNA (guanine-N(7)-)-methyltransferase [Cocos nucifera]